MQTRAIAVSSDGLALEAELVLPDASARGADAGAHSSGSPRATVVLCRGLPSGAPRDPADPDYAGLARTIANHGYAAVWFNFRGCYSAPGDFSIAGWARDLEAVIAAVRARPETASIPLYVAGSSAGGAVAICVGARSANVDGVATLAAVASWDFTSYASDLGALLARFRNSGIIRDPAFPSDPDAWLAEFDAVDAAGAVAAIAPRPLLIVHGDSDEVVPYPHAERLFAAAGAPKELARIPAGTHQLRKDPRAVAALLDWLDRRADESPGTSMA